jgi:hypothetical protein
MTMKRRSFLEWLGFGLPATVKLNTVNSVPEMPLLSYDPEEADEQNIYFGDMREYLEIDLDNSVIDVFLPRGYDAVAINSIYSTINDIFDEPSYMQYMMPMSAQTSMHYIMINGWCLTKWSYDKLACGSLRSDDNSILRTHIKGIGRGHKGLTPTWEVSKDGRILSSGRFRNDKKIDETIETINFPLRSTLKVTLSDGDRWHGEFETELCYGNIYVHVITNDMYWKQWLDTVQKHK